jgi:hypothetical protein
MHYVKVIGLVLGAVLNASATASAQAKGDDTDARQAPQASPTTEVESRFAPPQKKYIETLSYLIGLGRMPNVLVQSCDHRFPSRRDQHHQALAEWDAKNQAVVEELEKRRAIVVSARARGNIVQIAERERAFNAGVAKDAMNLLSETDNDENLARCANLKAILASAHFDLDPGNDNSMNASLIKIVSAVSPSQLGAWSVQ